MRSRLICVALVSGLACVGGYRCLGGPEPQRGALKIEAHLIWGTDDDKSPNPNHKSVDEEIMKKLKQLPLKWAHYFEVNRQTLEVPPNESKEAPMSEKCKIQVRDLGHSMVEVSLIGKGKIVFKQTQALPKNEVLILGGRAPNSTSWLVAVKRLK